MEGRICIVPETVTVPCHGCGDTLREGDRYFSADDDSSTVLCLKCAGSLATTRAIEAADDELPPEPIRPKRAHRRAEDWVLSKWP